MALPHRLENQGRRSTFSNSAAEKNLIGEFEELKEYPQIVEDQDYVLLTNVQ